MRTLDETLRLDAIADAVAAIRDGGAVIVVDDEDRENEGDIVFAASKATPELMAFTVRHTSGVICVPMPGAALDTLAVPPMTAVNEDAKGTAYSVSVDAVDGISTGISATDRARTMRVLADPASTARDLTRPGHVFPLRAVSGGVRVRGGHTEAAVELATLAGLPPVGAICELVDDLGELLRGDALRAFADRHELPLVAIADLARHLDAAETAAP